MVSKYLLITFTSTFFIILTSCASTITDKRDGQKYKIVTIGSQTWMAQNLKYQESKSKQSFPDTAGFYNWHTAINSCPDEWHLPNDSEWDSLISFLGEQMAGRLMKTDDRLLGWGDSLTTDPYGFNIKPEGAWYRNNNFLEDQGYDAFYWSSTEYDSLFANARYLDESNQVHKTHFDKEHYLLTVRCIKNPHE